MNVLIRNIPEDQLLRIDYKAKKKGISREEYIRQLVLLRSLKIKRALSELRIS